MTRLSGEICVCGFGPDNMSAIFQKDKQTQELLMLHINQGQALFVLSLTLVMVI